MKQRRRARTPLAVGSVSLLLVAILVLIEMQRNSPGGLSATHAQPAVRGRMNDCAACHGGGSRTMSMACLDCHADIGDQIRAGSGLHGRLSRQQASTCAKCHSEHHGEGFQPVNRRSFLLAGIPNPLEFDHAGTEYCLAGAHRSLACEKCHAHFNAKVLLPGQKRFLGLDQDCASCHQDVHRGAFGRDCEACHGQQHPFPRVARFEHTEAFALRGAHATAGCLDCHPKDGLHSIATQLSAGHFTSIAERGAALRASPLERGFPRAVRTCRSCHVSPHAESFLTSVANILQRNPDMSCQSCHPVAHGAFHGPQATVSTRLHALTGFRLDAPHDKLKCVQCHPGFGSEEGDAAAFHRSFPGRQQDDCASCHEDPHRGQFESGESRKRSCLDCHDRHRFLPSTFSRAGHQQTSFPLRGAHAALECKRCHRQVALDGKLTADDHAGECVRVFRGTPKSCRGCHQDPHRGEFEQGPFRGQDCAACHDENSFRPPTFTFDQHAQTRFPLTGAHAAVACNRCHQPRGAGEKAARVEPTNGPRAGLAAFHNTPTECRACHEDPHNGAFDHPGVPATVGNATGCARCHSTDSFREVSREAFDHGRWAGFALRGAHAKTDCAKCHLPTREPGHVGRTFGRASGRTCQSCHSDPHVGQFGPTRSVNCSKCHSEGMSFRELVFDHQRDSRFRLDRDHVNLSCAACHRPQKLPGGGTAVRFKPLGTKCADCHLRPARTKRTGEPD